MKKGLKIFKFWRYVFYKQYSWIIYLNPNDSKRVSEFAAMTAYMLIHFLLLRSLIDVFDQIANTNYSYLLSGHMLSHRQYYYIIALIWFGICLLFLLYKKRYKRYIAEFIHETEKQKRIGTIIVLLYMLFALAVPLLFGSLHGSHIFY
ncbi:MAG: hypothetical protein WCT77_06300 [Bacteroidota bacterium]